MNKQETAFVENEYSLGKYRVEEIAEITNEIIDCKTDLFLGDQLINYELNEISKIEPGRYMLIYLHKEMKNETITFDVTDDDLYFYY